MIWMACYVLEFHIVIGILAWKERDMAMFRMCWCFLSIMPFYYGVSTQELWWRIPFDWKKESIKNSGPLSLLKHFKVMWSWFSMYEKKLMLLVMVSSLVFRKIIQVNLLKSSIKVRKYLCPKRDTVDKRPQRSSCSKSKGAREIKVLKGKDNFFCLA